MTGLREPDAASVGTQLRTAAFPGVPARLLTTDVREELDEYRAAGGYTAPGDVEALLGAVESAGVRGRGGAAFPLARKLRSVRATGTPTVLVANGEEGEPASIKDRWLMRHRPHLVLDGMALAAAVIGAESVYAYVSDPESAVSLTNATESARAAGLGLTRVVVHTVDAAYVAGEETAAVRSIGGGPALPQDKPPRPFESGVDGLPTLVSNVETLANIPFIHRFGADAYRVAGTSTSPGTFLSTLSGTAHDGLYELPFGVTLREVLQWLRDDTVVRGALVGGYFSGVLGEHVLDLPLDYDSFSAASSGLGCGAMAVIDPSRCPVAVTAGVLDYFDRENAGQCGSCFNGTAAMAAVARALCEGRASESDVDRLSAWSRTLRGRGACGTLDGAANVAAALLREFPGEVAERLRAPECASSGVASSSGLPPFAVTSLSKGQFV